MKVGGGMGRTPVIGSVVREFLPWDQLLNYIEAVVRTYNSYGRRDNKWKARIKILVKSEGQKFIDAVEKEYKAIVELDGAPHTITQAELDRVSSHFVLPELKAANLPSKVSPQGQLYQRWLQQNVRGHKLPGLKTVTLSFKRPGSNTGDADADTLNALAQLAEQFSAAEARLTHEQNLMLPWVHESDLPALYEAARALGLAQPNIGLLTDMIICPGGDFCSLANARSLHIGAAVPAAEVVPLAPAAVVEDRLAAMCVAYGGESIGDLTNRRLPVDLLERSVGSLAQRCEQPIAAVLVVVQAQCLFAGVPLRGRVGLVAADALEGVPVGPETDLDAAVALTQDAGRWVPLAVAHDATLGHNVA